MYTGMFAVSYIDVHSTSMTDATSEREKRKERLAWYIRLCIYVRFKFIRTQIFFYRIDAGMRRTHGAPAYSAQVHVHVCPNERRNENETSDGWTTR